MKRVFFTPPVIKILTVVGVLAAFVLTIYFMSGLPAPSESNRVTPTAAPFSIIHPPEWQADVYYSPIEGAFETTIKISPIRSVGPTQALFVGLLHKEPDIQKLKTAGMIEGTFQGKPALLFSGQKKREFVWRAIFERDGRWYELSLHLTRPEDIPNSDWWPYLNSFETHPIAATVPAIPAATEPSTTANSLPLEIMQ